MLKSEYDRADIVSALFDIKKLSIVDKSVNRPYN